MFFRPKLRRAKTLRYRNKIHHSLGTCSLYREHKYLTCDMLRRKKYATCVYAVHSLAPAFNLASQDTQEIDHRHSTSKLAVHQQHLVRLCFGDQLKTRYILSIAHLSQIVRTPQLSVQRRIERSRILEPAIRSPGYSESSLAAECWYKVFRQVSV